MLRTSSRGSLLNLESYSSSYKARSSYSSSSLSNSNSIYDKKVQEADIKDSLIDTSMGTRIPIQIRHMNDVNIEKPEIVNLIDNFIQPSRFLLHREPAIIKIPVTRHVISSAPSNDANGTSYYHYEYHRRETKHY